jgi:CDP-glucose 4,6-dehydratase
VIDIVRLLQRIMGRTDLDPVILDQARAEIRDQYLDATKAHRLLGWKPKYSLESGLQATVSWYEKFLNGRQLATPLKS